MICFIPGWMHSGQPTAASVEEIADFQLVSVSKEFVEAWRSVLNSVFKAPDSFTRVEEERFCQRGWQGQALKWVELTSCLTLTEADAQTQLLVLGEAWQGLIQRAGLKSGAPRWGYHQNRLYLKLQARAVVTRKNRKRTVTIAKITMVQPLSKKISSGMDWRGIWPVGPESLIKPDDDEVFSLPEIEPNLPPKPDSFPDGEAAKPLVDRPRVCIIIDDVGYVRKAADKMLEVPARLTWSILPFTPYGKEYETAALAKNFEIMLHLPLEPLDNSENPGPGLIKRQWSEAAILSQLDENLREVAAAKGVNNHMGSAGTADERLMDILMRELKRRQLFFVDSYTSNQSVAGRFAREHGVPLGRRAVFIDHHDAYASKKKALRELMDLALRDGVAIGIGHVREGTAEAIIEMIPEFGRSGIDIVPASELVK